MLFLAIKIFPKKEILPSILLLKRKFLLLKSFPKRKYCHQTHLSEPVLTQLRLTPDNPDPVPTRYVPPRSRSPLVLVSHFVSVPVVPHLGLCSIRRDSGPVPDIFLRPRSPSYYVFVVPPSGRPMSFFRLRDHPR